ncbi:uncharacterized protein FMAN_15267 [Fusarium mangiferae]|uniref:Uncharacterized protein n=1 Tax=Fusarium mangiferae TaxID=192010 RepID=A0A1L7UH93_FUSMA|nr:uncharacterized protein FMAN_15267 [Fusarium mangiferae]CVL07107.1 uncharacterized protein FMAN_15267 [Fusarium mangiferae]
MAEHVKLSPDSSQPCAPSLDKCPTASRKVSPTEAPLPSPPDSAERTRAAAGSLPKVLVEVVRELDDSPLEVDYYKSFPLSWEDFKSAREVIEATIRRFDYDPFKGKITIRMTTPIHDSFAGLVSEAIAIKLFPLKTGDNATARFAKSIIPVLSARNYLDNPKRPAFPVQDPEKKEQKSPDLQYCHKMAEYSGIVVEIAYTQPAKQLRKLALAYIRGSMGKIQTVIGSAYWLEVEQVLKEVPFRSADGEPLNQDCELVLSLHEMTADQSLREGVDNKSISILFKDLCVFMNTVAEIEEMQLENLQKPHGAEQQAQINGIPVKIKEPISSSPEEELASEDEKIFADQEEAQRKKAKNDDTPFSRTVDKDIKGRPNVATRAGPPKRPAPTNTGENLPVAKRRSKRRRD